MPPIPPEPPRLSIGFILLPRFTLNSFAGFIDVLRLAADTGDGSRPIKCQWEVLSSDTRPIPSSCGVGVSPTASLTSKTKFDYIAVVGGLLREGERLNDKEAAFIRAHAKAGTRLIGLCTGSFELLKLGLMERRRCCVSWFHVADLEESYPDTIPVADQLYVIDGKRITCAGGVGTIYLAGRLVEKHCGFEEAAKALRILQVDQPGAPVPAQPVQVPFPRPRKARVRRSLLMIEENLSRPPSPQAMADALGISRRQLDRDFMDDLGLSPGAASLTLRLAHGRRMLETSDLSVTQIAVVSGFSDAAHFARQFRKTYGETPRDARKSATAATH